MPKPLRTAALFFALIVASVSLVHAQDATIVFDEPEHHFGEIVEGEQATHVFTFRNVGTMPLTLTDVRPSCGCTSPDWTQDPVAPGESGEITVVYDSKGRPGPFKKTIAVRSDGTPGYLRLYIDGNVAPRAITDGSLQGNVMFDRAKAHHADAERGPQLVDTFLLQNKGERPIRITGHAPLPENIRVAYPRTPIFSGDVVEIEVGVLTDALPAGGLFDVPIVLETDDAEVPQKKLHVSGTVAGPSGTR